MPVMLGATLLIATELVSYGSPRQSEFTVNSEAQQGIAVSGKVSSGSDKSKMVGVTVQIKGTNKGTITNADGEFNLSVPSNNSILIFSFIVMEFFIVSLLIKFNVLERFITEYEKGIIKE